MRAVSVWDMDAMKRYQFKGNARIETSVSVFDDGIKIVSINDASIRKRSKAKQTEEIFRLREEGYGVKEIATKLGISQDRVLHRLEKFEN